MHIADGWMTLSALDARRRLGAGRLHPAYPLHGDLDEISPSPSMLIAMQDSATHAFHADALQRPSPIKGVYRSLLKVDGVDRYDAVFGLELMLFAAYALREIGRHADHRGALSKGNIPVIGRMALVMLREIAPAHFVAYATYWAGTGDVKSLGYTADQLSDLLIEEHLDNDIGKALVIRAKNKRRFMPVAEASAFNPWLWNRQPPSEPWSSAREVARGVSGPQRDDGSFVRNLRREIRRVGENDERCFPSPTSLTQIAVTISAAIGPHGTPIGYDPTLLETSLDDAWRKLNPGKPRPKLVSRAAGKIARMGRRERRNRTK